MKKQKPIASRTVLSVILILAPQIFAFALALDIYVPSIPAIRQAFAVDQAVMQLTVSLFLLITGLGQLLFGPISDQIGRRKVLLASILFFIAGSVLCTVSYHITFLIIARIVQALGACGMMVSAFAIVRDLFSGDDCARIYSFLNSTISLSPLLAPLAGGYLAYWISWRASFALLAIVGLIIFFSAKSNIDETLAPNNRRNLKKELFVDYFHVLKSGHFLIYTLCASAGFAGFLAFFSSSSYIIINLLGIPEQHFGFYFAAIGIVFFFGSLLSGHSAKHIGTYKTVIIGAALMMLSGLVMLLGYQKFGLNIFTFIGPMVIMSIGGAFLMGGGAGGAISPFPEMAGTASALFGSMQFVFAFVISQIVMQWQVKSSLPLGYTLTILGLVALAASTISYKALHATTEKIIPLPS
jgi:Bcr/CflA subfamily drug resistance transporter